MVAELLDGNELGDFLDKRGKLSVPYAVGIVRQICKALAAAHAVNVVHRDMKPENVFLTGDMDHPHVKVLDFGISRLDDGDGQGLTKTGMIAGSPAYIAPEAWMGKPRPIDHRVDVYGFGVLIYRVLTGQLPFNPTQTIDKLLISRAKVLTEVTGMLKTSSGYGPTMLLPL